MWPESGKVLADAPRFSFPAEVRGSVHLKQDLQAGDFKVPATSDGDVTVSVICVVENQAPTQHLQVEMQPEHGELIADPESDLAKIALVERHQGNGTIQLGFVRGFGLDPGCAIGSTVAHDSHHMLVVGTDDSSMSIASNELARIGGGQIAVRSGEVIAVVELPIAGLMSDERAEVVADKVDRLLEAFLECGCTLNNANMQLSLLALVVIPELRLSDLGLVDVNRFELIPLVAENA